ncbi:MAG: hypothetical protein M1274_07220 [Actinobacteria bacterium]|nr:hypothetical protein [Actinomycetota bacterium]
MGKYDRLEEFLRLTPETEITLSFVQIETILGARLPASAQIYAALWANEKNGPHVQAKAWERAGFKAQASLTGQTVTFRRTTEAKLERMP